MSFVMFFSSKNIKIRIIDVIVVLAILFLTYFYHLSFWGTMVVFSAAIAFTECIYALFFRRSFYRLVSNIVVKTCVVFIVLYVCKEVHCEWIYVGLTVLGVVIVISLYLIKWKKMRKRMVEQSVFLKEIKFYSDELDLYLRELLAQKNIQSYKIVFYDSINTNAHQDDLGGDNLLIIFSTQILSSLTLRQIAAVTLHEVGHYLKKHRIHKKILAVLSACFIILIVGLFVTLCRTTFCLCLSYCVLHILLHVRNLCVEKYSLKCEYEADDYVIRCGYKNDMIDVMCILYNTSAGRMRMLEKRIKRFNSVI